MYSLTKLNKKNVCINPFGRAKCSMYRRPVKDWMIKKVPSLNLSDFICDTCRTRMKTYENQINTHTDESSGSCKIENPLDEIDIEAITDDPSDESFVSKDAAISSLNKFLGEVGASPIEKGKLRQKNYCTSKILEILNLLKSKLFDKYLPDNSGAEMLQQVKQKFDQSSGKKEKVKLLTLVPRSWSTAKIGVEFPGTKY